MVTPEKVVAGVRAVPSDKPRRSLRVSESLLGYVFVAPVVTCILLLIIYPLIFEIYISFTDRVVGSEGRFVGLANYAYLAGQPAFQTTIINTVIMVTAIQIIKLIIGLAFANLLNQPIRLRQLWRGLMIIPWAMPAFVAFIVWKLLFEPQGGAFNYILVNLGLTNNYVDFLSSKALAMPSVIVASVWRGFPFWVISFLAAMQNIPQELYESAAIDGANAWQRFSNITVPGIRHVILVVTLVSTIWTTNSFE